MRESFSTSSEIFPTFSGNWRVFHHMTIIIDRWEFQSQHIIKIWFLLGPYHWITFHINHYGILPWKIIKFLKNKEYTEKVIGLHWWRLGFWKGNKAKYRAYSQYLHWSLTCFQWKWNLAFAWKGKYWKFLIKWEKIWS
jgi:hypothetical protein